MLHVTKNFSVDHIRCHISIFTVFIIDQYL